MIASTPPLKQNRQPVRKRKKPVATRRERAEDADNSSSRRRADSIAIRAAETRLVCPQPTPAVAPSATTTTAFDDAKPAVTNANDKSSARSAFGARRVIVRHDVGAGDTPPPVRARTPPAIDVARVSPTSGRANSPRQKNPKRRLAR